MPTTTTSNRPYVGVAVAALIGVVAIVWALITFLVPPPPSPEEMGEMACGRAGGVMTTIGHDDLELYSWYVNVDGQVTKVTPEYGERVCALPPSVYRTGEHKHPRQILTNY